MVDHSTAAGGDTPTDGPRFDRAVDAVERILVALPEVHGTRTERIAWAAGHPEAALQFAHLPPQFGLALNHLLGRIPVRPFLLVVDGRYPRPPKTLASDADAIAERPPATLDQIKEVILRIDNDRAGLLLRRIKDGRAKIRWVDVGQSYCRDGKALAIHWRIEGRILAPESGVDVHGVAGPRRRVSIRC